MRIINRKLLIKHLRKRKGNRSLRQAIEKLIKDFEDGKWRNPEQLKKDRPDADNVHSDGFYFFNLSDHRTMILIEFTDEEATVIWCGTHAEYDFIFRNNKNTIRRWPRKRNWIR